MNSRYTEYLAPSLEWEPGFNLTEPLEHGCALKLSETYMIVITSAAGQGPSTVRKYINSGWSEELPNLRTPRSSFSCSLLKNETFTGILVAGGTKGSTGDVETLFFIHEL